MVERCLGNISHKKEKEEVIDLDRLAGKTIVSTREERTPQKSLFFLFSDGSEMKVMETGGPGADSGYYTFPAVFFRQNAKEEFCRIWNG